MKKFKEIPEFEHEKLLSKIIVEKETGCWSWTGYFNNNKQPVMSIERVPFSVKRISYCIFNNKKNVENNISNNCGNIKCINPDHLEELSMLSILLRNENTLAYKSAMSLYCKKGHLLDSLNVYRKPSDSENTRNCRTCKRDAQLVKNMSDEQRKKRKLSNKNSKSREKIKYEIYNLFLKELKNDPT